VLWHFEDVLWSCCMNHFDIVLWHCENVLCSWRFLGFASWFCFLGWIGMWTWSWVWGIYSPLWEGKRILGWRVYLGLHDWGPWSMGSIVCHFHSYSTLVVIRGKWWRKEVDEVWVWRNLNLLVVYGRGCLWSLERAWYLVHFWSPKGVDMIWYGKPPWKHTFNLCSRFYWRTFVKYLGMGLLSVVNVMVMHL
jgi:hypothetical protein